jgi:hypothetical protein
MQSDRFRLALRELKPSDWERFEQLASVFLAADFTSLRTLAAPSGDSGRDGALFAPTGQTHVAIQYSVAEDWKKKIRATVKRLEDGFTDIRILIYVTNQRIGADADSLKSELLIDKGLVLDVRDANWFLERSDADDARSGAAEKLATVIVDPLLAREGVKHAGQALTNGESRAGLLYLTLQWEDDSREKGLTKLSYEALVKAALRDTTSERRIPRTAVQDAVASMIPTQGRQVVNQHVDSALARMTKRLIRRWQKEDEFCLTFDEQQRLQGRLVSLRLAVDEFDAAVNETLGDQAVALGYDRAEVCTALGGTARELIEKVLLARGELFAQAVVTGDLSGLDVRSVRDDVVAHIGEHGTGGIKGDVVQLLTSTVERVILEGPEGTQRYVRRFADSYTLLAFMRETPDVQDAVTKMFSHGEIWLDTTILLPLMAETLLEAEQRRFADLMRAATESGLELRVTSGVLEEVERHINRCRACINTAAAKWIGRIPFLLSSFLSAGQPPSGFDYWIETFAGRARPLDDIADYFKDTFGVVLKDLEEDADKASPELRGAVQEVWHAAHERRRGTGGIEIDAITLQRLVAHDVENYVGVIQRRATERASPLGYNSWFLSLDPTAFAVRQVLRDQLKERTPDSPVLSADFLANYLALGPARRRLSKEAEQKLPVLLRGLDDLPQELLELAEKARAAAAGLADRLIVRRVRDELDKAKRRQGTIAKEGIRGVETRIREQLAASRLKTTKKST